MINITNGIIPKYFDMNKFKKIVEIGVFNNNKHFSLKIRKHILKMHISISPYDLLSYIEYINDLINKNHLIVDDMKYLAKTIFIIIRRWNGDYYKNFYKNFPVVDKKYMFVIKYRGENITIFNIKSMNSINNDNYHDAMILYEYFKEENFTKKLPLFMASFKKRLLKNIIILSGKKRVGKDTVGDFYIGLNPTYNRFAFADGLKDFTLKLLRFLTNQHHHIHDDKDKQMIHINKFISMRELLQKLGDITRNIDENIWVRYLNKKMKYRQNIVITDCRYEDELSYIIKKHGKSSVKHIRITRGNDDECNNDEHKSEKLDFNKYDILCKNDGSITDLYDKVKNFND
jgi:hypothetical protein